MRRAWQGVKPRGTARRCLDCLPGAPVADPDRGPLKDTVEMERFRDALRRAGLPD
jgi:hypothetical protein